MRVTPDTSNKYCSSEDLSNEASVESFFVLRMLSDLGYKDSEIKTKRAIEELKIPKGRGRELFKPDYLLLCKKEPRWVIDAKAVGENIDDFAYQCAGYSLMINRKYRSRPIRFFMLTNGLLTRVYPWDQDEPILSLRFADFAEGNNKYGALKELLSAESARKAWGSSAEEIDGHLLARPNMDVVKRAFVRCHRIIWKSEKMSPQAAFVAFAKLMFVKLWEDRRIRDDEKLLAAIGRGDPIPADEVRFSLKWILEQESHTPNPADSILFRQLVDSIEADIARKKRKRIFEPDEKLGLSPGTVRRIVEELQGYYLFGIDEDLNGRMFEAFLAATMRGQDLGQYFTPRSIVKVISKLAHLHAGKDHIDRVLDACCGTGGFLIEALTVMRKQVWDNNSLTRTDRDKLLDEIANEAIFGIDAGREPPIARIARINMYLHGDGGSRVYVTDSLRKIPDTPISDPLEIRGEVEELRGLLARGPLFDAILTNPPFSMDYSLSNPDEAEILKQYELATYGGKVAGNLRSSVLFLERYLELLKPGGRFLTVIDDSVLGGKSYALIRQYIREKFIIRAIVSLHGDAFQRSGARTKTSVLYLEKPKSVGEIQPSAFVYESRYIGLDDVVPKTPDSVAASARKAAQEEMADILAAFDEYLKGRSGPWLISADKLGDRLDAKYLRPWRAIRLQKDWVKAGAKTAILGDLVDNIEEPIRLEAAQKYTFINVTYSGRCERGEDRLGKEVTYKKISIARVDDLVVSGMGAVYRAICVVPPPMSGLLISSEFTILRIKPDVKLDPMYLWSVLRSAAIVAEWLSDSTGLGRARVGWDVLKRQTIPLLPYPQQKRIGDKYRKAILREIEALELRDDALADLNALKLEGEEAKDKLERAKPPQ